MNNKIVIKLMKVNSMSQDPLVFLIQGQPGKGETKRRYPPLMEITFNDFPDKVAKINKTESFASIMGYYYKCINCIAPNPFRFSVIVPKFYASFRKSENCLIYTNFLTTMPRLHQIKILSNKY